MMMNATKYTFDFFSADSEAPSEATRNRRRRTLTEAEIESLCASAHAEGRQSGEVRALEAIAAGAQEAAETLSRTLAQLTKERQAQREEAAGLAFALARKLAHAALARFPQADVEVALREAMHQALGEPRIVLKAAPPVAEAIAPRLSEIAHEEGFEGRVQISPDPALSRADCRIEWRGGGAERAETAIEKALEELISRNFRDAAMTTVDGGAGHDQQ